MGEKEEKKRKRKPCCEKQGLRKGAWNVEEDKLLVDFIAKNGCGNWSCLPKQAGLLRCGKSCRLRWANYLRPDIERGPFSLEEEKTIIRMHGEFGNRWAAIASKLPGRTDNDIKNFWNTHMRKCLGSTVLNLNQPTSPSYAVDMKFDSSSPYSADLRYDSLFQNIPSNSNTGGDYFISLWNSEVGESFRNISGIGGKGASSHSQASQTSSLTKVDSTDRKVDFWSCKKEPEEAAEAYSDFTRTCEFDDSSSSDAMMKLLLDYPVGGDDDNDDMEFLEGYN